MLGDNVQSQKCYFTQRVDRLKRVNALKRVSTPDPVLDLFAEVVDSLQRANLSQDRLAAWITEKAKGIKPWRKQAVEEQVAAGELHRACRALITSTGGMGCKKFLGHFERLVNELFG